VFHYIDLSVDLSDLQSVVDQLSAFFFPITKFGLGFENGLRFIFFRHAYLLMLTVDNNIYTHYLYSPDTGSI